jgi:hypothetical protein
MEKKSALITAIQNLQDEDLQSAYDYIQYLIHKRKTVTSSISLSLHGHPNATRDFSWQDVLNIIRKKLSKPSFDTWFHDTAGKKKNDTLYIVSCSSTFQQEWLETRYRNIIEEAILQLHGRQLKLEIKIHSNHHE